MTAREIAPEVDRLVWSVRRAERTRHADDIRAQTLAAGLGSLQVVGDLAEFLVHEGLERALAKLRFRYRDQAEVDARINHLVETGYLVEDPALRATARLRPVLLFLLDARTATTTGAWADEDALPTAIQLAVESAAAATGDDHPVAARHLALPRPHEPAAVLDHILVTLRYVRQHDHAAAWLDRDLSTGEIVLLTRLWRQDDSEATTDPAAVAALADRGWVEPDGSALTPLGRSEREAIERATNERSDLVYGVLGPRTRDFLDALQALPDADAMAN